MLVKIGLCLLLAALASCQDATTGDSGISTETTRNPIATTNSTAIPTTVVIPAATTTSPVEVIAVPKIPSVNETKSAKVTSPCFIDEDCKGGYFICKEDICQCHPDSITSEDEEGCFSVAANVGDECKINKQCENIDGICEEGKCIIKGTPETVVAPPQSKVQTAAKEVDTDSATATKEVENSAASTSAVFSIVICSSALLIQNL